LILLAYFLDLSSSVTRIPSVLSFLFMGWLIKEAVGATGIVLPDLDGILPIVGTVGLVLIVLEGSLELELRQDRFPLIKKAFFIALVPMMVFALALAWFLRTSGAGDWRSALLNSLPVAIISSAIAIPSAKRLTAENSEFVTYESSFSDIIGVIFFNFFALNEAVNGAAITGFVRDLGIVFIASGIAVGVLSLLLSRLKHHVKSVPILIMTVGVYAALKVFHLPALIFVMLFGLFLSNNGRIENLKLLKRFNLARLRDEAEPFHQIVVEIAFVVRATFFVLFGYLLKTEEVLNPSSLPLALGIVAGLFGIRALFLRFSGKPLHPLLFVAPRGLITVLLFVSIAPEVRVPLISSSLIIQVILLTAFLMMLGLLKADGTSVREVRQ
jgi:hypothetical protein